MTDHQHRQRVDHANVSTVGTSNTESEYVQISTPTSAGRYSRHATSFTYNESLATVDLPQTPSNLRRRRRPNVDRLMRSSMMKRSSASFSSSRTKNSKTVSDAVQCDCEQLSIRIPPDHKTDQTLEGTNSLDPLASLTLLRDTLGPLTKSKGHIDRATFSQTFEVNEKDFDGYETASGMVDSQAFLIDAATELDVDAEKKLRFIFDTLDDNHVGSITTDQIIQLLETNFAHAELELMGTDSRAVAELMFCKANAHNGTMDYSQFRYVFLPYVTASFSVDQSTQRDHCASVSQPITRREFSSWYDRNKLRVWWLVIYIIANLVTIYHKWNRYSVDPAIGYGLRIARCGSQVAMLNSLFVLTPMLRSVTQVMKRSKLLWRIIPFDDHIIAHKIIGSVLLSAGLVHTGAHISNQIMLYLVATPQMISDSIFVERKAKAFEHGLPPFTTMLQVIPVWTGIIMVLITLISFPLAAIPKFRQGNFNLFWYSHMLLGIYLIMLCIHGATSWLERSTSYMWVGPPFALYLLERRFRYAKIFTTPVRIIEAVELDETYAVIMEKPRRFVYRPGMYLLINCPTLSNHEWHPFTISSAPGDSYLSIHIRKAGDWTSAFHKLIADCHANKTEYPEVYLDGPVGSPTQDYHRYSTLICVAA